MPRLGLLRKPCRSPSSTTRVLRIPSSNLICRRRLNVVKGSATGQLANSPLNRSRSSSSVKRSAYPAVPEALAIQAGCPSFLTSKSYTWLMSQKGYNLPVRYYLCLKRCPPTHPAPGHPWSSDAEVSRAGSNPSCSTEFLGRVPDRDGGQCRLLLKYSARRARNDCSAKAASLLLHDSPIRRYCC